MNEVILLVGPAGSGKTTYCKESLPHHYRVSQDDMGRFEHIENFKTAIENGVDKIVVDRMNFSMAQRHDYLQLAKEHGYKTKIITLNQPFATCYNRIQNRENHPTLKKEDALKVLSMYFDKYEYPLDWEADEIERSFYDPFMIDVSKIFADKRKIVAGDPHGCFDEVMLLLKKCQYKPVEDVLLFGGDFIDRGPKIKEILTFIKDGHNVFTTMANHENKFLRYLRGNTVRITHGLEKTLEQLDDIIRDDNKKLELRMWLESQPYIIKFESDKYLVHGGINPEKPMARQSRDNLIYARTFDPTTKSFVTARAAPWWSFPGPDNTKVYFGHQVHSEAIVSPWAVSLDGGCVSGKKMRAAIVNGDRQEIVEVDGKEYVKVDENTENVLYHESLAPYEELVIKKYLTKSEKNELVLYNYSDACVFEKYWTDITRNARGIIFDKATGEIVAKPFPKFFNLSEMPESTLTNLPKEPYTITEKMDGSLGIFHWYKGKWDVATKGSFYSEQAAKAYEIINKKFALLDFEKVKKTKNKTLLFEIIYPQNKIVVNYGDTEDVVLLGGYDKDCRELTKNELLEISLACNFTLVKEHHYTIEEMIELQKTLPKDQEGFVVRWDNGLRVKIKGEEYLKIHRAIADCTPLNVHRNMVNGRLSIDFKKALPEEIMPDINKFQAVLEDKYDKLKDDVLLTIMPILDKVRDGSNIDGVLDEKLMKRNLGLYIKNNSIMYSNYAFPILLDRHDVIDKLIMEAIRPTGNML